MGEGSALAADWLDRYRGLPVLVTGATGFIGRWVCRRLTQAGARLVAVTRDARAFRDVASGYLIDGVPIVIDLGRPRALAAVLSEVQPAIMFNVAGYGVDRDERDPGLMARVNVELVAEAAATLAAATPPNGWSGLRLVHVGSAFEYGSNPGVIAETTPPLPETAYGKTKLEGTRRLQAVVADTGLAAATARVCTIYGPGEHAHRLLPSLIRAAGTGAALPLTAGEQMRDFTYVDDVAEGLLRIGTLPAVPAGLINLATGTLTSVRRFVEQASTEFGLHPDQVRFGATPYRPDEVWQGAVDVSRLEHLTGWRPTTTIVEGLRRTWALRATGGGGTPA